MNGAREYAKLFPGTNQRGRLLLVAGAHARGLTFHIYVLPEGFDFHTHGKTSYDRVEVYGIIGGNPGWTETYGWLRQGPWKQDFEKIVDEQKERNKAREEQEAADKQEVENARQSRINQLLSTY